MFILQQWSYNHAWIFESPWAFPCCSVHHISTRNCKVCLKITDFIIITECTHSASSGSLVSLNLKVHTPSYNFWVLVQESESLFRARQIACAITSVCVTCMQRAFTKLRARKSIKTLLSSSLMLIKVASCFCVWKQIIFGTTRSDIRNVF